MKKAISLILALVLCLSLCACGGASKSGEANSDGRNETTGGGVLSEDVPMYTPMTSIETGFGEVTVLDAAFCAKAQLYYTKSSFSQKSTVNGKTTESYSETIHPGYLSAQDGKVVFALRTMITNTSGEDIEILKLPVTAFFETDTPVYFSKGGNVQISDDAYKILAAGASSEIILAALVPVEQYMAASECLLEIDGVKLGFDYDSISVYNALGYQEGDNTPCTIDDVLQLVASSLKPAATEAATEPEETEPEIVTTAGVSAKDGVSGMAEGRAITVEKVALGFTDTLPNLVTSSSSYSRNTDQYAINESEVYAVIQFTVTNLTKEELKLVDTKGNFAVQVNYNNGYQYSTYSGTYACLVSDGGYGMVRKGSSFTSSGGMVVTPLSSAEVTAYIPCARQVAENPDKPLTVTFISKYSGNESLEFTFPNRA